MVAAMRAHPQAAGVQEQGSCALGHVCRGVGAAAQARTQRAAEAGALEAVVAAMQAHLQAAGGQEHACLVLRNVCGGVDAAALARRQRAVEAGAIEAVVGPIM